MKKFVIVCGGECHVDKIPAEIFDDAFVIAADSGYNTALRLGVRVDLLVGDMDSIGEIPDEVELLRVKAEKDYTDTMLAVDIATERGAEKIILVGGGGGRADHWLSNIFVLESLCDRGIISEMTDGVNRIFVLKDSEVTLSKTGGYFALLALEDCTVSAVGCKYPLENAFLTRTHPYAVSNEVISDEAKVTVKGKIIITESLVSHL